jgi:hypothetical protein
MRATRSLTMMAVVLFSGAFARADETIDNPEFASWSKFKTGTSITIKIASEFGGMVSESVQMVKLIEATADKLVLETAITMTVAGTKIEVPPMKRDVPKKVTITDEVKKARADAEKAQAEAKSEDGTETLTVSGDKFKCKWHRTKITIMGNETDTKIWTSEEVPGGTVKMESTTGGAMSVKTKFEVTDFKKG